MAKHDGNNGMLEQHRQHVQDQIWQDQREVAHKVDKLESMDKAWEAKMLQRHHDRAKNKTSAEPFYLKDISGAAIHEKTKQKVQAHVHGKKQKKAAAADGGNKNLWQQMTEAAGDQINSEKKRSRTKLGLYYGVDQRLKQEDMDQEVRSVMENLRQYALMDVQIRDGPLYVSTERNQISDVYHSLEKLEKKPLTKKDHKLVRESRIWLERYRGALNVKELENPGWRREETQAHGVKRTVFKEPAQGSQADTVKKVELDCRGSSLGDEDGQMLDMKDRLLFAHEPTVKDVKQGNKLGDCYLLSVLGSLANKDPDAIRACMRDNGDSVTVRFYGPASEEQEELVPYYVTVDKKVPKTKSKAQDTLWVQLIERAYAFSQIHSIQRKKTDELKEAPQYKHISSGFSDTFMENITGKKAKHYGNIGEISLQANHGKNMAAYLKKDASAAVEKAYPKLKSDLDKSSANLETQRTHFKEMKERYEQAEKARKKYLGHRKKRSLHGMRMRTNTYEARLLSDPSNKDYIGLKRQADTSRAELEQAQHDMAEAERAHSQVQDIYDLKVYCKAFGRQEPTVAGQLTAEQEEELKKLHAVYPVVARQLEKYVAKNLDHGVSGRLAKDGKKVTYLDRTNSLEDVYQQLVEHREKLTRSVDRKMRDYVKKLSDQELKNLLESASASLNLNYKPFSGDYTPNAMRFYRKAKKAEKNRVVTAGSYRFVPRGLKKKETEKRGGAGESIRGGLVQGHSFSVLGVVSSYDKRRKKEIRYIKLRNPHSFLGREYAWDENGELQNHIVDKQTDGVFCMELNDFMQNFGKLDIL